MTTRLPDVVEVKTFEKVVQGELADNSKFRQSGVITTDPRVSKLVATAGFETTLPFWKRPAGGEATSQSDDPTDKATPGKVQMGNMLARIIARSTSFSAMHIADLASDADAIAFATSEFARLRLSDEESAMYAILEGIVAAGGNPFQVNAAITTGEIADANMFNIASALEGRKKKGDLGGGLKTAVLHSDVVNNMRAREPNAFIPASQTKLGLEQYAGWNIIETDSAPKDTTVADYPVYTNYLLGDGMFAYGSANVERALVQFFDELAGGGSGEETVLNRFRYALHPLGYSNVAEAANGVSQTNAELADADTWALAAQNAKTVPLVAVKTNG